MLTEFQKKKLKSFLEEDRGKKDVTSALLSPEPAKATIKANEACTLSGLEEAAFIFSLSGAKAMLFAKDGQKIAKNKNVFEATGTNKGLLEAERAALNVLGRMSGVATICAKAHTKARGKTKIFLTRKTMPGLNEFDKKACMHGGVFPHRKNLEEMILIKENHLEFEGIESLLEKAKNQKFKTPAKKVEIEVQNQAQAILAASHGADIIMLDNFSPSQAKKAVKAVKDINKKILVELSGGISLKNMNKYISLGADMISMGELTKNAKMADFSMDLKKAKK